jgi:hypothetical protein
MAGIDPKVTPTSEARPEVFVHRLIMYIAFVSGPNLAIFSWPIV